jgi:formylglycine-generating enzyme required for sulfatase activity
VIDKMRKMLPGMLFDLPTEAQWEFACRAGTVTQNYSGVPTTSEANTVADLAVLGKCGASGMVEVGSFRPNAFGLYDVIGNVGEAVRDLYDPNEYIISVDKKYVVPMSGDQIEPMGWNDGGAVLAADATCMMMYRGGTAERDYKYNRCSDRRQWYAIDSTWSNRFGYRLWLMAE